MTMRAPFIPIANRRWNAPRGHTGFTLIEVLVGVSIIAVLISSLLPALGAARERARGIVCASNQRQLLLAWSSYADDHRGAPLPAALPSSQSATPVYWWGRTDPDHNRIDPNPGPIGAYLEASLGDGSVYECPSQPLGSYVAQPFGAEGATSTYGYNGYAFTPTLTGYANLQNLARSRWWLRRNQVRFPSRQLVFGDAMLALGGELRNSSLLDPPELFTSRGWQPNPSPTTAFRHLDQTSTSSSPLTGGANTATMDGSVAPMPMDREQTNIPEFALGSVGSMESFRYIQDAERWQ